MATVLIVEDADEFRQMVSFYVRRLGYEVIEASNGLDGIKLAKAHVPSVIILDLMMPVAQGDLTLGFIRSTPDLKHIPVIVTSAHPNAPVIAQQLDANACLMKPFSFGELEETLHRLM